MTTTITATPEPNATPPRVRLDVTTTLKSLTIYRVGSDGSRTPVRSYDGGPFPISAGKLVAHDPEAPLGLPVSYTSSDSATTGSATVTVTSDQVWLTHPGIPQKSLTVEVSNLSERIYEANQSVRYPLMRRFPIVAADGVRKAATYDLTILTEQFADITPMLNLFADVSPLLLQVPAEFGWALISEYVAVGRLSEGRLVQIGAFPMREWIAACSVVDRPAGGGRVDNTYAKSLAAYPTYGARRAAHSTYGLAFNS